MDIRNIWQSISLLTQKQTKEKLAEFAEDLGTLASKNYWSGTQAEYDNLTTEEKEDPKTLFFITED